MRRVATLAVPVLVLALGAYWLARPITPAAARGLYGTHCAGCHGANLEGAPNWQQRSEDGRWPPPPHDATGHTWHHADAQLFQIVRDGPQSILGPNYRTDMPAFSGVLSDAEIRAVLAYIKSTWPEEQREYQALMNRPAAERLLQP